MWALPENARALEVAGDGFWPNRWALGDCSWKASFLFARPRLRFPCVLYQLSSRPNPEAPPSQTDSSDKLQIQAGVSRSALLGPSSSWGLRPVACHDRFRHPLRPDAPRQPGHRFDFHRGSGRDVQRELGQVWLTLLGIFNSGVLTGADRRYGVLPVRRVRP